MSKKSKTKQKKSKFSFSIIILIIFLFLLVNANLFTNAQEVGQKEMSNFKMKETEMPIQDVTKENKILGEEISNDAELKIRESVYDGKIDLSPEKVEVEPEFINVKMLRLENNTLLETKLNHYMNSLIDVVQYKIEKNKKNLEEAHEEIINTMEQITEHHSLIDKHIKRQDNFQANYEKHLKRTQIIIVFLSLIGLIIVFLIYYIWRSFVNINKNEAEVVSIAEDMKHRITELQNEIEMLKKKV